MGASPVSHLITLAIISVTKEKIDHYIRMVLGCFEFLSPFLRCFRHPLLF